MTLRPDGVIRYPMKQWDIPLCVSRGQAFRWQEAGGGWLGVDAGRVMWLRPLADVTLDSWHRHPADGPTDSVEYSTLPEPCREDWVRSYFQLEVDLTRVHAAVVRAEPDLEPLIARFPGLRVLRWGSAEECLLSFLCSVNNNIPRISGMIERLCTHLGPPLAIGLRGFPPAQVIADTSEEDLRGLGFGYRARTLLAAARALCDKPAGWLESLARRSYEEARWELQSLPGVGRKVADCVCLFGLGFQQAAPVDTHLWQAMCERYFHEWRGATLTERRYSAVTTLLAERFGDLAGWAHQYLFYDRLLRRQARSVSP